MKTKNIAFLILASVLLLFSCTPEVDCERFGCGGNGTCTDKGCICLEGWTGNYCDTPACETLGCENFGDCTPNGCDCRPENYGTFCELKTADRFVGVWTLSESCRAGTEQVTIVEGIVNQLKIEGIYGHQDDVVGEIESAHRISLRTQGFDPPQITGNIFVETSTRLKAELVVDGVSCTGWLNK